MRSIFLTGIIFYAGIVFAQRGDNHLAVWGGINASNFTQTSPFKKTSDLKYGYSFFVGSKSYINEIPDLMLGYQVKGGYNTLAVITSAGTGSETFAVDLSYITAVLPWKFNIIFSSNGHLRLLAGPYVDYLVGMKSHALYASDLRTVNSFKKFGCGIHYGFDVNLVTTDRFGLTLALYAQNGFTKAGDNTGYTFRNNTYSLLLGIGYAL